MFKIALKTLASVFKALNWILKLVGIDLGKILAWLGHLFGWDDIWDTHKKIAAMMRNGLDTFVERASHDVDGWRATAGGALDNLDKQVRELILLASASSSSANGQAAGIRSQNRGASFSRPQNNFTLYQVQHGGIVAGTGVAIPGGDAVGQFANDLLIPTFNSIIGAVEKDIAALRDLVSDPDHMFDNLRVLLVDLIETVLTPLKTLVDGALKLLVDVLHDLKGALGDEVDLPFISSFYEFVTDILGDEEDFTFINGIALLLAIPIVEISKATIGHPPFDGVEGVDESDYFDRLVPSADHPKPVRMMLAATPRSALAEKPAGGASELSRASKGYRKAGGIIYPIGIFIGDILALVSIAKATEGGEGEDIASTLDKVQAAFALAALSQAFPLEAKNGDNDALWCKRAAWLALVANNALLWRLKGNMTKGGWFFFTSLVALILSAVGDGLGDEEWDAWIPDIVTNIGGMVGGAAAAADQEEIAVAGGGIIFLGDVAGLVAGIANAVSG